MTLSEDELTRYIAGLRSGDPVILEEFWRNYGPMLERLAARNISPGVQRRLGADDVAQSACRTFLRRAQGGEFQLDDSDGLTRLLCSITLTKIREKTRYHTRKKRGLQFEVNADDAGEQSNHSVGPAAEAEFNDLMTAVLAELDDHERGVLELRLQGCKQEEIAEKLNCSERTVRRTLQRIQMKFEKLVEE